jgi:hypothetical protein
MRAALGLRVTLAALTFLGLASLAAILTDAVVILPAVVRAIAPWVLGLSAAGVAAAGVSRLARFSELAVARRLEAGFPELGTVMTNAVQLSSPPAYTSDTAVEKVLRARAVELGRRSAAGVGVWPVERRRVRAFALAAAFTVALWGAGALIHADAFRSILPRFLDPYGDHPPYSVLKFEVAPGDTKVPYGGQIEIRARATGRPVERLHLVASAHRDDAGGRSEAMRAAMFAAPDGSFFQTMANLRETTEYYVTDGRARSHRFTIGIRLVPRITMAEARAEFPDYTGRRPQTLRLLAKGSEAGPGAGDEAGGQQAALSACVRQHAQAGDLRLPLDTHLTFRIASNRPLGSGTLALTPVMGGDRRDVVLTVEDGAGAGRGGEGNVIVQGGFTLDGPVAFSVSVVDVDGLVSRTPLRGRISVQPDERPRVFVAQPGRHAVATPKVVVPVRVGAEDDHAVEKVLWFRSHNGSVSRPREMELRPGPRGLPLSAEGTGEFDLGSLGVRPGDVIEYYAEAVDNYPRGPNLATSRILKLEIISVEEYRKILRMMAARKALLQAYETLGAWLERLSERGKALAENVDEPGSLKEARTLARDLAEYREALAKALGQPEMFDVEAHLKKELAEQHRRLERLQREIDDALARGDLGGVARAARDLAELSRYERQQVGEPVRHVKSVVEVLAMARKFIALTLEQRRLVKIAGRFEDHAGDLSRIERMEMQELAHHERTIRGGLDGIVAELPGLLDALPKDAEYDDLRGTADAFLAAVNAAGIADDLAAAAGAFADLDGKLACPKAESALEKMEKLVKKCSPSGMGTPDFRPVFQPALADAMSSSVDQILAAMGIGAAGSGYGGSDGYSLFADDVALYGPHAEMSGGAGELGGEGPAAAGDGAGEARTDFRRDATDARDPALDGAGARPRVGLERDARFPLRYRTLVGEYFRVIAETFAEED